MADFPESDWQKLRNVREKALNRLCARIISNVEEKCRLEKASGSPHKAYGQIYALVRDSDKIVAELFDDWRSTIFFVLCGWLREGLLTRDEFELLSDDTKKSVHEHVQVKYFNQ